MSESDLHIEKIIIDDLSRLYPDYSIYSEETGEIRKSSEKYWILDPIDGTADFIFGVPYFGISICSEIDGEICEAYVYNPMSDEMYWTNRQEGISYLNGKPIKASGTSQIRDSLIAFGFSANYKYINQYYDEWGYVFDNCKKGIFLKSIILRRDFVFMGSAQQSPTSLGGGFPIEKAVNGMSISSRRT